MTENRTRREIWDERHAAQDPIESPEPDPVLVDLIAGLEPGRALDLATGDGRNAIALARGGWQVTAVDFSPVGLQRAATRAAAAGVVVEWVEADLLAWQPTRRAFDLVALVYLHFAEDERRSVYANAADAVAPGGLLLVVGHDRTNLTEGSGGPQDADRLFSAGEIAADLVGFDIERAGRVIRPQPDGRRMIDAVLVARRRPEA